MNLRVKIVLISALVIFGILNYMVYLKEQLKQDGKIMLLELAPVDPRSLMQGDYMALRYVIESVISRQYGAIIRVDEQGIGQFIDLYTGQKLGKNETVMPYSIRNNKVYIIPDEFNFLPKEHLEYYEKAQYAIFKYHMGNQLLIGLADESGTEIVPPVIPDEKSDANRFNWHENKFREDKQYTQLMEQGKTMLLPIIYVEAKSFRLPTMTKFQYYIEPEVVDVLVRGYVKQGQAVIGIGKKNIGHFKRLYTGEELGKNEALVSYFVRDDNVFLDPNDDIFITPNAFFFQEGHAKYYEDAHYGVFKYDAGGNKLLIGLADKSGLMIVPPKKGKPAPSP